MAESTVLEETIDENYEPTVEEIEEYAKWLGMDLQEDKHLFWVAREGLKAPLPSEWKPCKSPDGELYYFNFSSGESVWDHPCDDFYRARYKEEKEKNPRPAPAQESKPRNAKKRPKATGKGAPASNGAGTLKAVVAPRDRSNLSAAADLLGPLKTPSSSMGTVPDVSTTEHEAPKGPSADAHQASVKPPGTSIATANASAESRSASEPVRQQEFDKWCAEMRETHERSKSEIKKRAQAATNDDAQKQLREKNGEQIRKIRLELDKLNLEKSNIESRSPMPAGSGHSEEEDALEKTRSEMTIQMERTKMEQELRVAELEERSRLVEDEKNSVDAAVAEADADLKRKLDVLQSEHTAAVEQSKTGYERQREKVMVAARDYEQLSQQQESSLLLKETERYTTELQQAMREARSVAEVEIDEQLRAAKVRQDQEADSKINAERSRLDATRERQVSQVTIDMEAVKTEKLRKVTADFSSTDSSKAAETTALENARAQVARQAERDVSSLEERLDMTRKEVRQGLPAAELQLKTQLASQLDQMETEFKKQLESERLSISKEDEIDGITELPSLKDTELREWQAEHQRASQQGIAAEVAELQQRVMAETRANKLDLEMEQVRTVDARKSELAAAQQPRERTISESYRKNIDTAKTVAQEANTNAIAKLRMQLQNEIAQRASDLRTRLTAEQAMSGAALEEQRTRVQKELTTARATRAAKLAHAETKLEEAQSSASTLHDDLICARLAHSALQVGVQLAAAVPQHASHSAQSTDLKIAKANLSQVKSSAQNELDQKLALYSREENDLKTQLAEIAHEQPVGGAIAGLEDGFAEQELAIRKQEFEAKTAVELSSVRANMQQERLRAKDTASRELAQLEQHVQAAMLVRVDSPNDGIDSRVGEQLAASRAEEASLKQMVKWATVELQSQQAQMTQLHTQQSGPTPFGNSDCNRQVPVTTRARKQTTATWAEPVATSHEVWQASDAGGSIAQVASAERQKLERARAAATKATRAMRDRQAQWAARRDEWLADMRSAKKAGDPGATEYLRGVKVAIREQAGVLNSEAHELNKKKQQIKLMTQQIRAMERQSTPDGGADELGGVSDALRTIDSDLLSVKHAISQHRKFGDEMDMQAQMELKWASSVI